MRIRQNSTRQRLGTRDLHHALGASERPPQADAAQFWSAFRAHATLHPQYNAAPVAAPTHLLRWGLSAACALLVMVGAGIWHQSLPAPLNRITAFDVVPQHEAVLVMDDAESHSTMLWIVGMVETNGDNG